MKHILESIHEDDPKDMPTLKAIGYTKVGGGWISYVITVKDKQVLSIEVSDPDMRQVAEDEAKINFVELFADRSFE